MNSQETRLRKIEQDTAVIKQQLKDHCESNEEHFVTLEEKMDKFIESADKKFAPRWVGDVVRYGIYTIVAGAFGLFIYLLERHIL